MPLDEADRDVSASRRTARSHLWPGRKSAPVSSQSWTHPSANAETVHPRTAPSVTMKATKREARSQDVQVLGRGPSDIVYVPPFVSNLELQW